MYRTDTRETEGMVARIVLDCLVTHHSLAQSGAGFLIDAEARLGPTQDDAIALSQIPASLDGRRDLVGQRASGHH